eukprot:436566-Ditylum_brightwellii.AAC.1
MDAMKKISFKLNEAVTNQLLTYTKVVQKKKKVSEEDEWLLETNPNTRYNKHKIKRTKEVCKEEVSENQEN